MIGKFVIKAGPPGERALFIYDNYPEASKYFGELQDYIKTRPGNDYMLWLAGPMSEENIQKVKDNLNIVSF